MYVVNNTFLNDDTAPGTFVQVGSGVTVPVLMQNNIFGGTGTLSNQATAIDRTNYRSIAPGFTSRANYDLHPTDALVINAGSAPGVSRSGVSLAPAFQYKHVAAGEPRVLAGAIDIGACKALVATPPAPPPTTPAVWTACAVQGGVCWFQGTAQVRYGAAGTYVIKTATTSVRCSNKVFGDPLPEVQKTCSYSSVKG